MLADGARYEAALDDIVQEVRRRAPLESAGLGQAQRGGVQAAAAAAAASQAAAPRAPVAFAPTLAASGAGLARLVPMAARGGVGGGVVLNSRSTITHARSTVHNNSSSDVINSGNSSATTIVLM